MARRFPITTAEHVLNAIEAIIVNQRPVDEQFISRFCDIPLESARAALDLAVDLGLLSKGSKLYRDASPLCRYVSIADASGRAAILRIAIESYEPFTRFRDRLVEAGDVTRAAKEIKTVLDLDAHHDDVKNTLINLGTFCQAMVSTGGNHYECTDKALIDPLRALASICSTNTQALARINEQIGNQAVGLVSQNEVLNPLADALVRANRGDPRGAVVAAGNAIESYLDALANRLAVSTAGATGINAKIEKLTTSKQMPKKLSNVGKYLGHIRNAADHGIDPDIGVSWEIRPSTGVEYVFVACSFIGAMTDRELGEPASI